MNSEINFKKMTLIDLNLYIVNTLPILSKDWLENVTKLVKYLSIYIF